VLLRVGCDRLVAGIFAACSPPAGFAHQLFFVTITRRTDASMQEDEARVIGTTMPTSNQVEAQRPQIAIRLAWSVCGIALTLLVLTLLLILLGHSMPLPEGYLSWQDHAVEAVGGFGPAILGLIIAVRRPTNRYGWLWCGLGLTLAVRAFGGSYAAYAAANPGALPASLVVAFAGELAWPVLVTLTAFVLLLFPDGRVPSRRWRVVARGAVAATGIMVIALPIGAEELDIAPLRNPLAVGGTLGQVALVLLYAGAIIIISAVILAALSLVLRFQRAIGVERQQIKWFAFAAAWFGAYFVFSGLLGQQLPGLWHSLAYTVTSGGLYVGVGIAILRYRLYDIDRVINRTLVYGLLTALLAGIYAGMVLLLGQLFGGLSEQAPSWTVAAATLTVAALFQPARRRIQQAVDRRFNRRRYDLAKTVEAFSARLRDEVDLDTLSAELLEVVDKTVEPTKVSLWLQPTREAVRAPGVRT
jgi:hypothetical protein